MCAPTPPFKIFLPPANWCSCVVSVDHVIDDLKFEIEKNNLKKKNKKNKNDASKRPRSVDGSREAYKFI